MGDLLPAPGVPPPKPPPPDNNKTELHVQESNLEGCGKNTEKMFPVDLDDQRICA